MLPLRLKVYLMEGDRKIENFSEEQWDEICVIYLKLVRNLRQEIPEMEVDNFCNETIPYISMEINFPESYELTEEKLEHIAQYLCGDETENPVYFREEEEPHFTGSDIILKKEDTASLLERFNKMVIDLEDSNN